MDEENSQNIPHQEGHVGAQKREGGEVAIDIPISKLKPNPDQPRAHFDELEHKWLTESIAKNGVLQPILVRPVEGDEFMIIAGERRYRAAKAAGRASLPAVVVTQEDRPLEEVDVKGLALMENLQRSELNDYELAVGVTEYLRQRLGLSEKSQVISFLRRMYNQTLRPDDKQHVEPTEAIFRELGRSWASFSTTQLNVFSLHPELQKQLRLGKLDLSKARVLNRVQDDETRDHLMWNAIANGWTRAQLRREIGDLSNDRILNRTEETNRAQIASDITGFRKTYVKHRRQLPAATIAHIKKTLEELDALVLASIEDSQEGNRAA